MIQHEYQVRKNVADASGWSEARISQILSPTHRGGRGFSEKVARKLEADLGLESMYFDQGAIQMSLDMARVDTGHKVPEVIFIPLCTIVVRDGVPATEAVEIINEGQAFAPYFGTWLKEMEIKPAKAGLFRAPDDSMSPRFERDDVVLANCDDTEVVDGRMYVIRYAKTMKIRFLSRRLDGTLTLRSANPNYPDEHLPAEVAKEYISVIGRVREIKVSSDL
ncbi:S24 family peptidase [Massilia antarctica]|uniref:S24 family peptidase n=1 Tax=Massilia antarctica TaxID=2765360 RepID=UPI0022719674|nr:S24 family peptidase [Massilia sp. H27-R4]MCY0913227.1 S24 family peptidase [Massilia sp. H27-R4]